MLWYLFIQIKRAFPLFVVFFFRYLVRHKWYRKKECKNKVERLKKNHKIGIVKIMMSSSYVRSDPTYDTECWALRAGA